MMHQVLRQQVFAANGPNVTAELLALEGTHPPHSHGFLELAIVVGGSGTHESAWGRQPLRRGSVVLVRPGEWHRYETCRDLAVWNLYVTPEVRDGELSGLRSDRLLSRALWAPRVQAPAARGDSRPWPMVGEVSEPALGSIEATLRSIADDGAPRAGGGARRIGLLLQVLGEVGGAVVSEEPEGERPGSGSHPALIAAARLLEEEPERPWTLADLANRVHVSAPYLVRLFTKELGVPPIAYLTRLRAERVAALLIESGASIGEIGRTVGWDDPSYAGRRFSSVFGVSPRAYRRAFRPAG
jgi:AraC family L-rhamnose operon transcriptional activator RhaR